MPPVAYLIILIDFNNSYVLNLQASPVVGILTRQDLGAYNILAAFPYLAKSREAERH